MSNCTTKEQFIEEVFELAFGDNAINRDFSFQEVLTKLKEEGEELHHYQENTLVLYDRCQLDDWKSQFTDEPTTDEEWRNFQNHRDVDYALEVATDYLNGAESTVIDEDKYIESEVQDV